MSKFAVTLDGRTFTVEFRPPVGDEAFTVIEVDGQPLPITLPTPGDLHWLIVNGQPLQLDFDSDFDWVRTATGLHRIEVRDLEAVTRPIVSGGDGRIKAPIPGTVTRLFVQSGQTVEAGQPILILEAMKMQNEMRAPKAGTITGIHVEEGKTVSRGTVLVEVQ